MQRYNVRHRDRAQRKVKGHRLTTSRGAQRVDVVVDGTGTRTRVVLRCVLWSLETKPFYAANIVVANAKKM